MCVCVCVRDGFYELLRQWQEQHLSPGWSLLDAHRHRIVELVTARATLANHVHLARIFLSQLLHMCRGDSSALTQPDGDDDVTLLMQLKLHNPDKFQRYCCQ